MMGIMMISTAVRVTVKWKLDGSVQVETGIVQMFVKESRELK